MQWVALRDFVLIAAGKNLHFQIADGNGLLFGKVEDVGVGNMKPFDDDDRARTNYLGLAPVAYHYSRVLLYPHTYTSGVGNHYLGHAHKATPVGKVGIDAYVFQKLQPGGYLDLPCRLLHVLAA